MPHAFDFLMFDGEAEWLASQPGMSPWKEGCANLAARLQAWLEDYSRSLCGQMTNGACRRLCLCRMWRCWAYHWKQAAALQRSGTIDGLEVAQRLTSGRGYVGKKNLGGDPLRDVVLVQATQCGQEQALLRLGKEYKHNALGMAIKVNRRVRDDPEDWWNRFLVALGGYENPPGNLASFAGKCGLKNWLATVAGRFARKYPPPPPPQPIDVYQDDPPDLRNRTPKQEEEEEQAHERARKRALGVRKILDGLPTEDQVMIHLIYEHGLHQNAVAVRMGIKPWIITRKKKRWMKLFRRLL